MRIQPVLHVFCNMALAARCLAASLLSGILLVLAMPLGEQAYLAWFAFVPILIATRGTKFTIGLVCGLASVFFAAWLSTRGWLYRHTHPTGADAWVYTGFGIYGFSASIALGAWADRSSAKLPAWWFAAFATLAEAALLLELPAHFALTQYRQVLVLRLASVGGVWLVSFLLWWVNFALARLSWKRLMLGVPAIAGAAIGLGWIRLPTAHSTTVLAAVQIAEPEDNAIIAMQREASDAKPALVVWPEFSGMMLAPAGNTKALCKLSAGTGIAPFVTSFRDGASPPHNMAALFAKGRESERYAKRKLFGGEKQMHQPGDKAVAVDYPGGRVGLEICYDSTFPSISRETARLPGVNLIVVPSIDPESSNSFMSAMHAAYTPFRAAEEGLAFVKADGYAYSQIVDPYGQIVAEAPPGDRVLVGAVSTDVSGTLYKSAGDWFLWLCGILVIVGLWRHRRRADNSVDAATVPPSSGDL